MAEIIDFSIDIIKFLIYGFFVVYIVNTAFIALIRSWYLTHQKLSSEYEEEIRKSREQETQETQETK